MGTDLTTGIYKDAKTTGDYPSQQELPHLPPSAQTVFDFVKSHPGCTGKDVKEGTGLPRRTVYSATEKLKEHGLVDARGSLSDSRQEKYFTTAYLQELKQAKKEMPASVPASAAAQKVMTPRNPILLHDEEELLPEEPPSRSKTKETSYQRWCRENGVGNN